jgi:hypothetical protein
MKGRAIAFLAVLMLLASPAEATTMGGKPRLLTKIQPLAGCGGSQPPIGAPVRRREF